MEEWHDLGTVLKQSNNLDKDKYNAVLVSISAIPCATGCCTVDIFIRPNTTDYMVAEQLYGARENAFLYNLGWKPKTILDAGGNIGLATVMFAHLFPEAYIVVIEPDPDNFALLTLNTYRFANVHRENKGLWDRETGLNVKSYKGSWGTIVQEVGMLEKAMIQATTIQALLDKHKLDGFEYLKIDIEGAEGKVFSDAKYNNKGWIQKGRLFSIETHEWLTKGAYKLVATALQAGRKTPLKESLSGEYHVFEKVQ